MMKRSVGSPCLTLIILITLSSTVHSVNRVRRQTTDSSVRRGGDSSLHSSRPLIEGPSSIDSELRPFDPLILEGDAVSTGRQITFERKEVPHDFYRPASEEGGRWRWPESSEATHHSQSWTLNNEEDIHSELETPEISTGSQPGEVNYLNRKPAEESLEDSLTHPEEAVQVMERFPEHLPNLDITEEVLFTPSDPAVNSALNTPEVSFGSNEETPSQKTTTSFEKELLTKSILSSSIEDFSVWPTQSKLTSTTSINNIKHFNPTLIVSFSHINTTESSNPMLSSSVNSIPEYKEETTRFTLHTRKPNNITNKSIPVTVSIPKTGNSTSANRHSKFIPPSYPKNNIRVQSNNETKSEVLNTTVSNKKTNLSNSSKELSSNVLSTVASSSHEDLAVIFQAKTPSVTSHKSFQQPTSSTSHSTSTIISTKLLKPIRNSSNWADISTTKNPNVSVTQDTLTETVKIISNHSMDSKKLSVFPSFSEAVNRTVFQKVLSSTENPLFGISDIATPINKQATRKTNSSVGFEKNATPSLVTEFTTVHTQLTESLPTMSASITTPQTTKINSTSKRTNFSILETPSLPTDSTSLSALANTSEISTVLTSQSIVTASTVFVPTAPSVLTDSSTVEKFSIPTVPSVFSDTTLLRTIHRKRLPDQMLTTPIRPTVRTSEGTLPPFLFSTQSTEQSNHQINHNSIIPPKKDGTEATEDILYEENTHDSQLITASTTHTIIISSVIGGCAILFFAFLMIFCMWKQRVNRRARFRQPELGIINQLNGKH